MLSQQIFKKIVSVSALVAVMSWVGNASAQLTIVSFGGAYQEGQSKALFQPAAKALGITVKEETYTGIADLRLKVKAGAVTWDIVASGSGSAARAGAEGLLDDPLARPQDAGDDLPLQVLDDVLH